MKVQIYCRKTTKGNLNFYLKTGRNEFYLFSQKYRATIYEYYCHYRTLEEALDHGRATRSRILLHVMSKLPRYIKYVEEEENFQVLRSSKQSKSAAA